MIEKYILFLLLYIGAGSGSQYDPNLKYCSSLPTLFEGQIEGERLKNYVENANEFQNKILKDDNMYFEGRPQMLCLFGKDIGLIEQDKFWKSRPRYHRKSCLLNLKKCSKKSTHACTECQINVATKAKTMITVCDERQKSETTRSAASYSRILSTQPCEYDTFVIFFLCFCFFPSFSPPFFATLLISGPPLTF